jgi:undecaprenyl-diphosphatase
MEALRAPATRLLIPGVVLFALACALGVWVLARGNTPFTVDAGWNVLLAQWRVGAIEVFSRAMSVVGGAWASVIVTVAGAAALLVARRTWGALLLVSAQILSAALVQVLKHLFGRARPEDILVLSDYGSFPSGHTANAATIAVVALVLFPRRWVAMVGAVWVVLMAFSRTYLHAHWASDTLGGALVGSAAVLVVAALYTGRLRQESAARTRRRRPLRHRG